MFGGKSEGERISLEHQVALGPRQKEHHLCFSPSKGETLVFSLLFSEKG